jgi:hypothetical protein
MASSPTFDANTLDSDWENLVNDPSSPLFDRAGMGLYPPGNVLGGFLLADSQQPISGQLIGDALQGCALIPPDTSQQAGISAGCTEPIKLLVQSVGEQTLINLLKRLGLYMAPPFPIETLSSTPPDSITEPITYVTGLRDPETGAQLQVSPLQMALAASTLSNEGWRPAPRLVMSVNTPQAGWVMIPPSSEPQQVYSTVVSNNTANALSDDELAIWQVVSAGDEGVGNSLDTKPGYAWFIGGTLPDWGGVPLAVAVLLEENNPQRALEIGQSILQSAMRP